MSNLDQHLEASHSFSKRCVVCDGDCIHRRYSGKLRRFVSAHLEAYTAAYLDGSRSADNELRRMEHEYRTLPKWHSCSCWCKYERCESNQVYCARRHYHYVCTECQRLRRDRQTDPDDVRSRGSTLGPETPMVLLLDYMAGLM